MLWLLTVPPPQVVDTIGAGDFFTAGFLFAYLSGASLQQCAAAGCAAGSEAVQATGAELTHEAAGRLRKCVAELVSGAAAGSNGNGS